MVAAAARIGPNAIVQLAHALRAVEGDAGVTRLFRAARLTRYLGHWPEAMVDEVEVASLHQALWREWLPGSARRVSRDAGTRTGDYLLAHRIPPLLQGLLRRLPAAVAARLLMRAMVHHAWTFAGSGHFCVSQTRRGSARWVLEIRGNPLCHGAPRGEQPACEARSDDACRFEICW